jgi:hypothetical protein
MACELEFDAPTIQPGTADGLAQPPKVLRSIDKRLLRRYLQAEHRNDADDLVVFSYAELPPLLTTSDPMHRLDLTHTSAHRIFTGCF